MAANQQRLAIEDLHQRYPGGRSGLSEIDHLEDLMREEDQDLYAWISGSKPGPERFVALMNEIESVTAGKGK